MRPSKLINSKYLNYYLNFFYKSGEIVKYQAGSNNLRNLKFKDYIGIDIPVPSLNQQNSIVQKIEALFSELDKGIESLKTARAQLKVYRQALLKHAFEGKLTEQWRKDNADKLETADELLARIQKEREACYQQQLDEWNVMVVQWIADGKEGRKPAKPKPTKILDELIDKDSSNNLQLPELWSWVRIGDVSSVGTGVTPLKSRTDFYNDGTVAWVTSGALNKPYVSEASNYITELALLETNLKLYPSGTLLMAMYGEGKTRGKCSELQIPATTNQAIAAIVQQGLEKYTRKYLKWFLFKNYNDIRKRSSGGVQPNLNLGIVKNTLFPLCSIEEMNEIADVLEQKLSIVDSVNADIYLQLSKSEALRQSILKKAFSGKLVPQDPNDDPASELLKRIAKEKSEIEAQLKAKKVSKKKSKKKTTTTKKKISKKVKTV